jgi:tetratricopeptide (TPR) repeat protein
MLILHLESPNRGQQGDHAYRTMQPCRALGELENVTVVSGSLLTPSVHALLEEADVLVLCDVVDADFLPVIEARRRRRRLSVYEINDHFQAPQPWSATAYLATNYISRSLSSQLARQSDCLQLTVPELDRRFGHLNPRRAIFPNQLWAPPPPPAAEPPPDGPLRIGWGGSVGHREDIKWIIPVLRGVLSRHPQAQLAIMGDPSLRDLFAWVPRGRFEFTTGASLEAYQSFVAGLDIGLGPLLPTAFNRCRSDVKFLEYAAGGALAICSNLEPYQKTIRPGRNGLLFHDLGELDRLLESALTDPAGRRAMTATAAREIAGDRLERGHARNRLGFYLSMAAAFGFATRLAPRHPTPIGGAPVAAAPPASGPGARTFEGSRYLAFGAGEVEQLLYQGLVLQQAARPDEARRCFAEAVRLAPEFYVAPMFLAGVEPDGAEALRALRRAEQLNPRSCNVAFLIGAQRQAAGDLDGAARAFERCREIAPSFGAAQARLGELAEAAGDLDQACRLYEEAALRNSYFALPVARLAMIALRDGRLEKAVGLLGQSLQNDADLWLTNFLIGRGYIALKHFYQARVHLLRALESAEDRGAVLAQLAKAEVGLGNMQAARNALDELKSLGAAARE